MAVDEYLFQRVHKEPGLTALRLYTWSPGAITIGYHQKSESAVDRRYLGDTVIVRRITGGRAVFHAENELTYAVASHPTEDHPLSGSLMQSGETIAIVLRQFLMGIGIESEYARRSSAVEKKPERLHVTPCFQSVSQFELKTKSRKIIASAQRRDGNCLLQHGAIKLSPTMEHRALSRSLSETSVPHEDCSALGPEVPSDFIGAFEQSWGISAKRCDLSDSELIEVTKRRNSIAENPLSKRAFF